MRVPTDQEVMRDAMRINGERDIWHPYDRTETIDENEDDYEYDPDEYESSL